MQLETPPFLQESTIHNPGRKDRISARYENLRLALTKYKKKNHTRRCLMEENNIVILIWSVYKHNLLGFNKIVS